MLIKKERRLLLFCTIFFFVLTLFPTACGNSKDTDVMQEKAPAETAEENAASEAAAEVSAPEETAEVSAPVETSEELSAPAETTENVPASEGPFDIPEDGVIFQGEDIMIRISDFREEEDYLAFHYEVDNHQDGEKIVFLDPFLINGEISTGGFMHTASPSGVSAGDFRINLGDLKFAGVKGVETVDGYLDIMDESGESLGDSGLLRMAQRGSGSAAGGIAHSDNVVYENNGIKISCLGSYQGETGEIRSVYLVSNNREELIKVHLDERFQLVNGKRGSDDPSFFRTTLDVTPGTIGLFSVVVDEMQPPVENADITLSIIGKEEQIAHIPVFMTIDGSSITAVADETEYCVKKVLTSSGLEKYYVLFYGKNTKKLRGILVEAFLPRTDSSEAKINDSHLDYSFPGIYDLDFVWTDNSNVKSGSSCHITVLGALEDPEHLQELDRIGFMTLEDPDTQEGITVDSVLLNEEGGFEDMNPEEYGKLGIHYEVYYDILGIPYDHQE